MEESFNREIAVQMYHFFQMLRDECHDFLINCRQADETYKAKKLQKIATKQSSPLGSVHEEINEKKDTLERKEAPKKRVFRNRQPNNPYKIRRPTPPFIFFLRENHHIYQQKYPNLNFAEIRKIVSKEWSEMSRELQDPYLKMAEDDRKRFQQDLIKNGVKPEQLKMRRKAAKQPEEVENNEDLKSISISGSLLDEDQ